MYGLSTKEVAVVERLYCLDCFRIVWMIEVTLCMSNVKDVLGNP